MEAKKIPARKCIGCNQMMPKADLIRIVRLAEDGSFVLDLNHKANGRGAYLCRNKECLTRAIKSKGLHRSFKGNVPMEMYQRLEEEIANA